MVDSLRRRPKNWVDFMMRFELGLEQPDPSRAWKSALTIALAYVVGGMIPLSAYLIVGDARAALRVSVAVTLVALAIFGAIKGRFTGVRRYAAGCKPRWSAASLQVLLSPSPALSLDHRSPQPNTNVLVCSRCSATALATSVVVTIPTSLEPSITSTR